MINVADWAEYVHCTQDWYDCLWQSLSQSPRFVPLYSTKLWSRSSAQEGKHQTPNWLLLYRSNCLMTSACQNLIKVCSTDGGDSSHCAHHHLDGVVWLSSSRCNLGINFQLVSFALPCQQLHLDPRTFLRWTSFPNFPSTSLWWICNYQSQETVCSACSTITRS